MLNAVIIEDERPAREMLVQALSDTGQPVHIEALLSSVREARNYFESGPMTDIIFSDVQLTDGYSFDIFKNNINQAPVIFITGYDEYIMNALSCNGIDYLLKPVNKSDLRSALLKYHNLRQHFSRHQNKLDQFLTQIRPTGKTRLIVRRGLEYLSLKIEDVVMLYTENKIVYIIDKSGKKYFGEKNLGRSESELDQKMFFRANRQTLININYVRSFRTFEKVKLMVELTLPGFNRDIIVSQENAPQFREWIYDC